MAENHLLNEPTTDLAHRLDGMTDDEAFMVLAALESASGYDVHDRDGETCYVPHLY